MKQLVVLSGLLLIVLSVLMAAVCVPREENNDVLCSDGRDNDSDNIVDCEDEDCIPFCNVLNRSSKNTPISITNDDSIVLMANTDCDSISMINTESNALMREIPVGDEPTSVVIHPDGMRAYVSNRADGTVMEITDLATEPTVSRTTDACSEPYGLALSPRGRTLYVTCAVDSTFLAIDTDSMEIAHTVPVVQGFFHRQVRGIAVSNDGDTDDFDETIHVVQFYSRPSGIVNDDFQPHETGEGTDFAGIGVVHLYAADDFSRLATVDLDPISDTGFVDPGGSGLPVGTYPNQLRGIVLHGGFGYVVSTGASPRGDVRFNANIFSLVSVYDLNPDRLSEVKNDADHRGTVELNSFVRNQQNREFLNVPFAVEFTTERVGYIASSGSDLLLRANWRFNGTFDIGSNLADNIQVGQRPVGIIASSDGSLGYVANEISRDVSVVDFSTQSEITRIQSCDPPSPGTDAFSIWRGKRFFTTGKARWSSEGWSSCEGCHPDGLSDNVTFHFPAGPRNVPPLNGSFAPNNPSDQRIFNWSAVRNEVHDFELNTRGVSGGVGAIVTDPGLDPANRVNLAAIPSSDDCTPVECAGPEDCPDTAACVEGFCVENHTNNLGSTVQAQSRCSVLDDWDLIKQYVQTIRSPKAPSNLDRAAVDRGRQVFIDNNCQNCHGGPKWTVSRLYYVPTIETSTVLLSAPLDPSSLPNPANAPSDTLQLANETLAGGPTRVTCVLRRVGTFGNPEIDIEVRKNMTSLAQGSSGFNVPSLLGVGQSEPYLHHGGAQTLEELFSPQFLRHHQANSPNFLSDVDENPETVQQRDDLIEFLRSIDDDTSPIDIPDGMDICPENLP